MPSPEGGRRRPHPRLPLRLPLTGTSLLVAGVTVVAIALVLGVAFTGAPSPTSQPRDAAAGDRGPLLLMHRSDPPPSTTTTTAPPSTVPAPPTTTAVHASSSPPSTAPTTTRPPAPAPKPAPDPAPGSGHPILPPDNPAADIAPSPPFDSVCESDGFDSDPCVQSAAQAMSAARATEGLGALTLPSNFESLDPGEQLFVLTDIERVDRGLPPVVGMVQELEDDAQSAANADTDPSPSSLPPGTSALRWGSNWAEAAGPMGASYSWMYDDGPGSGNTDCGAPGDSGCWGHRDNMLGFDGAQIAGGVLVMGAAQSGPAGAGSWSSDAELLVVLSGSPTFTYTWADAQAAGAR